MAGMNFQIPSRATEVTPSDTINLPYTTGFYVGGTGNVTVETEGGDIVTFNACPVGLIVPIRLTKILSTGTTATLLTRFGAGADPGVFAAPFLVLSDGLTFVLEADSDFITVPLNG